MAVEAVIAGHICLDIIPDVRGDVVFEPGRLIEAGAATLSCGGAVANTGLTMSKLGTPVQLVARIGKGIFGRAILEILSAHNPELTQTVTIVEDEPTSYTIVLNLTGHDRMFLHAPGCNNTFASSHVASDMLIKARLMHFGYPPLMARMFADDGEELLKLFQKAKAAGVTTSLDMSLPDADAPSGGADWQRILRRVLPYVDVFLPSIEELMFMLDRRAYEQVKGAVLAHVPDRLFSRLADQALAMGAKVVGVKAGSRGLYVKTATLEDFGRATPSGTWANAELWAPCFDVEVAGTTGAGDATISGFLMGLLRGMDPFEAARAGVAVGAFCCEAPDAVSGIRSWNEVQARIDEGWVRLDPHLGEEWIQHETGAYVRR